MLEDPGNALETSGKHSQRAAEIWDWAQSLDAPAVAGDAAYLFAAMPSQRILVLVSTAL